MQFASKVVKVTKRHRPAFTTKQVEEILRQWYNITAKVKELPSERDQNFHVLEYNYILKIANSNENASQLEFQNKIIQKIATVNQIRLHPNKEGEVMFQMNKHWIRLMDYLPGKVLAKSTHSDELLYSLGEHLARIDKELQEFAHPAMHREFHWDLINAESVVMDNTENLVKTESITYFLEQFKDIDLSKFRKSVIHNDANDYNVIIQNNKPQLIDFGDAVYTATVFELAIAIAYVILNKNDPISCAVQVLKGYHSILPLTEYELDNLFVLIAMRLCVSLTLSTLQIQEEPDNKYLLISAKPAKDALIKLQQLNPQFVRYVFRMAVNKLPKSLANLQLNKTLIKIVQGEYEAIDLSIGSTDLGLVEDFSAISINSKRKVLVGGHNETRLQYMHDAFKIKVNDGYNWRATHIGVDFFTQAGTAVYAPLDGIIHSFANNREKFGYGPTLILEHIHKDKKFYTFYGHLASIEHFEVGKEVKQGDKIAEIGTFEINGNWSPHLHFQLITDLMGHKGTFPSIVEYKYKDVWEIICPNPNILLDIPVPMKPNRSITEIISARQHHLGKSLSIAYSKPLKIVRGYMQYLYDHTGRQYLDAVNNIPHVGHNHPHVISELVKQVRVLTTNTRYLHDNIITYTEKLLEKLPKSLEVCFFVNSGSEANELAIRLARTYTQREDIIVLDCAYHGNTNLLIDISPYKFEGPGGSGRKDFVHTVATPDTFRGKYKGDDAGKLFATEIKEKVSKHKIAAFICESLPGVGGQIVLPEGYFKHAFEYVREAGGVCIADEVQVGFGRIGHYFWGFEQQEVVPDIVVMGKPIGNGHPMAAVVTTREIAEAFNNGMEYFNSFGGNPVSCAVGLAVLDVIEQEQLQLHALKVGTHLLNRLSELKNRYTIIGDVRGMGLYIGIELIKDKQLTPATEQAEYIANRMRDHGILISTDGPLHNVLKIKPPLQFTINNADFLVETLDKILQEDSITQCCE